MNEGSTPSERYLVRLAQKSFLNLWTYPNLFIDKLDNGRGDGKELCDLLVVCGQHVLVFSDKDVAWPGCAEVEVAWRRWFRKAVLKSADQIKGAQRWIAAYPDRVFLDRKCTKRFPLKLPTADKRRIHGIVVARGAASACRQFFSGGTGSLVVDPELRGLDHLSRQPLRPFAIGDVNPNGPFIHVLDEAALDVVLGEMDTITDFTAYLEKKERLQRSGQFVGAQGEEELVAYYATHMNAGGEHDFAAPDGSAWSPNSKFFIESGTFARMVAHPQYIAKRAADRVSYLWDDLIKAFTNHMLAGTTVVPDGERFEVGFYEEGVRHMALVSRFDRRNFGAAIREAIERSSEVDRFTRAMLPGPSAPQPGTGFFFMTLRVPEGMRIDYERYRAVRLSMLEVYALTFLRMHPRLERIVGIATEPLLPNDERKGSSEDLILVEAPVWDDDLLMQLEERQRAYAIARKGHYREYEVRGDEFPPVSRASLATEHFGALSRKERRDLAERQRRRRR